MRTLPWGKPAGSPPRRTAQPAVAQPAAGSPLGRPVVQIQSIGNEEHGVNRPLGRRDPTTGPASTLANQ